MQRVPKPCGRREQNVFKELRKVKPGLHIKQWELNGAGAKDLDKNQDLPDLAGK